MKGIWFKRKNGEKTVPMFTLTDGKVDFKALGRHFLLNPGTITLNSYGFSLDSDGKSDASWMQIKDALGVEGTEADPVLVDGNPVNAAELSDLENVFSKVSLHLQKLEQKMEEQGEHVGNIERKVDMVMEKVEQVDSSSSFLPSVTEFDKGVQVINSAVKLVLPKPLSAEEVEAFWPEVWWLDKEVPSPELYFKELLSGLIDNASTCWKIKFTGSSPSVRGPNSKPYVVIYKRPPSKNIGPVALTTGAILELHSGSGKYNSNAAIGKAARYGEQMLENLMGFRRSVLVGVTDMRKVQWFKVIRVNRGKFRYEMHCELNDVRGSLCALLKCSLRYLEVELSVLSVRGVEYEQIRFLGSGATSNVLCVIDEAGKEYAAKIPVGDKNLQNDHEMLACLTDVKGVPKTLGWFDDGASLKIHPVGRKISCKNISSCWSLVPGLVDVLQKAHKIGLINRDVRPDNIMIAKGESEETEMLYILDWGFAIRKGKSYQWRCDVCLREGIRRVGKWELRYFG